MKLSIIIPNYNGEELLKKNLPRVFEAVDYYLQKTKEQAEIIIVDDCSTDNSLEEIQNSKFKIQNDNLKLKIIESEKNLGFASTVNRGVNKAEGEILILLNTDVAPEKDFIFPLIEHFKDEKVFAVGCLDKSIEGLKVTLRGRGIGKWSRGFLVHSRGEVDNNNTLWVNGGSGAFRKSIWDKLGGFNELYNPFYWEDIDLSYRALKSGYKIVFEPKSIVVHEHEKGAIKQKYSKFFVKTIAYRNQFIFVWLNATDINILFSHLFWLPYRILISIIRKDYAFLFGLLKASFLIFNVIKFKFELNKFFIKSDKEVTEEFLS